LSWFFVAGFGFCFVCVFLRWFASREGTVSLLEWRFVSSEWAIGLPLTKAVSFKTLLQKGNRVQVPKLVRWQFKMDTTQVLEVMVKLSGSWDSESFYARMGVDGRITVPWLALSLLQERANEGKSLTGQVLEVKIAPANEGSNQSNQSKGLNNAHHDCDQKPHA
jgi:hypothetical protein